MKPATFAWRMMAAAAALIVAPSAVQAQASPSPYTTGMRYDAAGRLTGTIAPDPDGTGPLKYAAVRNSYDPAGRLVKVEAGELAVWKSESVAPSAWGVDFTVFETVDTVHDAMGRKVKESVKGSDGIVATATQYSYDVGGRLECTAVRMNPAVFGSLPSSACTLGPEGTAGADRITRNVYDAAGQLLQIRKAVGTDIEAAEATFSYTPNGKRKYVIDGNGNRAELRYDGHDRPNRWVFPSVTPPSSYNDSTQASSLASAGALNEGDYESYAYDANGNRTSLRKRDGSILTYNYDALNRMTVKVVPSRTGLTAAQTRDVHYDYDLLGLMTKARFDSLSGDGVTSSYTGFGELISSQISMGGLSRTLSYAHDKEGRRTELTHADGQKFTYARDGLGRATLIHEGTSATSSAYVTRYVYNADATMASATWGTGSNGVIQSFQYDPIGRPASLTNNLPATANDITFGFTWNPASQLRTEQRGNDAYAWTGSVPVNRVYTTNGLNQYTAAGPASFCYDANGNLTADGSSVYKYDIENRLVEKRLQTSAECPTHTTGYSGALLASLVYDPMGRLFETSGGTAGVTRFLYDGDELVAEFDSSGIQTHRYVHGDRPDDPVVQYDGSAVGAAYRTYLVSDRLGSIVALSRGNGTLRAINTYDEYGIPGSGNVGRFQYTGQAWLAELGMYHYKARLYSPTLGRFLQTDPVGYDDQFNLYAYVGNDPVNHSDSTGQYAETVVDAALIGADFADIAANGLNWTNGISLGANIVGAALPGATGLGLGTRAIMRGEQKLSKVEKSTSVRTIGGKFTEKTKIIPGKGPGQSRAEIKVVKNADGKTIRTQKDSYDRAGKFQHRKPLGGGPEGRQTSGSTPRPKEPPPPPKVKDDE